MDPSKTVEPGKLTDKQIEAVAYLEKEAERYHRLAEKSKDVGCPILAQACESFSKSLKAAIELQCRVIRNPQQFFGFK